MPKYVLTYHGMPAELPSDPADREQMMAAWGEWYGAIGADLVDGGAPFSVSSAIDGNGGTETPASLTGYTIVNAADSAAATKIAQGSPVLAHGATVQISECVDM